MNLYVIDTNVILLAGTRVACVPAEQIGCYEKCVEFLNAVQKSKDMILLDDVGLILKEYEKVYTACTYPNYGVVFYEYLLGHMKYQHIEETETYSYLPYPNEKALLEFDPPDRKFIAVAYAYSGYAPIVEASDSKWWGIKNVLRKCNLEVVFIDENYIRNKYKMKMT